MRNSKVDLLRSLAILLVILAHASPPNWLMQVRTFDVVLLFLLAGGGYFAVQKKQSNSFQNNRIKHFCIPPTRAQADFAGVWRDSRLLADG